jgi:hypothetical protein
MTAGEEMWIFQLTTSPAKLRPTAVNMSRLPPTADVAVTNRLRRTWGPGPPEAAGPVMGPSNRSGRPRVPAHFFLDGRISPPATVQPGRKASEDANARLIGIPEHRCEFSIHRCFMAVCCAHQYGAVR